LTAAISSSIAVAPGAFSRLLVLLPGETYAPGTVTGRTGTPTATAGALTAVRVNATDPNFNLISEPLMIVRREAADQTFASVIEPHGYFSELEERSANARGVVRNVRVLSSTAEASVVTDATEEKRA